MNASGSSPWIPRLSARDTLALWRAAAAPRTLLVMFGAASWTLGLGWMATMVRFNEGGYEPAEEQRYLNGLMAALFVFALPATCGVVVAEVAQELLRRPLTNRLPHIAERTGSAACTLALFLAAAMGALAYLASSPASVLLGPDDSTRPTLLAYVALALLGYPAGAWLRGHRVAQLFWLVRFGVFLGLAYGAVRIVAFASGSPAIGIGLLCVGAAATWNRFHPRICWGVARSGMPTTFQFVDGLMGGQGVQVAPLGDGGHRLPSATTGGTLRGWWAAYRYEQNTMRRSMGRDRAMVSMAFGTFGVCLLWPLARSLFGSGAPGTVALALVGGERAPSDLAVESAMRTAYLMVGGVVALLAVVSSRPFATRFPYPIARTQRASLGLVVAARMILGFLVCFVGFALLARIWILPLAGVESGPGVAPLVQVCLVQAVLFPAYVAVSLWTGYLLGRGRRWAALGVLGSGLFLLYASAGSLQYWADGTLWESWWQVALGFGGAWALGFALLGLVLRRHYRRCDLA